MTVTPYCNHLFRDRLFQDRLFQDRRELFQFLSVCKQRSFDQSAVVSLSLEIDPIDPLVVLQKLNRPDQLSFYFEQGNTAAADGLAIAAIDAVACLQVEGSDRFTAAKAFIRSTLAATITAGRSRLPFAGPHFFCSFAFDHQSDQAAAFPAATVFLPAWQISRKNDCTTIVANIDLQSNPLEFIVDDVWQTLQTIRSIKYDLLLPAVSQQAFLKKQNVTDTAHFKQAVRSALTSIQANWFHKIVLAHAVDVRSPLPFDAVHSLHRLRKLYPDCTIFSTSNRQGQQFVGASPERLVSLHDRTLMTDALAGSAPRGRTTSEDIQLADRLLNSAKEIHEHQVVAEFITQQLTRLGLTPHCSPRQLLQLPNIQHLQTPIHAIVPAGTHLLDVVAELHPTPAVAGLPRAIACEQIRRYERFERSLYAAPIGWVDQQGNGEFVVGIRSALINGCQARLFAGAGIVTGSDPDRELAEVQLKLQALLAALV